MRSFLCLVILAGLLTCTRSASAQRSADLALGVTANNRGGFACSLDQAAFTFGNVDAAGTDFGTAGVVADGRNGADDGATYTAASVATWTCSTAPVGVISFALASSGGDHTGTMPMDALAVQLPAVGLGASTGYQPFSSAASLMTGVVIGNGAGAASGDVDLRLAVLDGDPPGANTWLVRITATAIP